MRTSFAVIGCDATIQQVAERMRELSVGILPVVDRDLAVRVVAAGEDPAGIVVSHVMTGEAEACHTHQDVQEVARQTEDRQV